MDPIAFEVIRNALVAATDEMVLALRKSAYSTNIKTRSDFSCAFFDAELALGRAGLHAARASRLDGRADAARDPRLRPGKPRPGRRADHERPVPERRAPERRQLDLAGVRRRRAARVRREPGPSRRRRRRRAREHRRVSRGLSGGRDHPAGEDRRGRPDRARHLRADPRADSIQARDGRGLPRADRCEQHGRSPPAGARRASRPGNDRRNDARAARLHRAAHPRGARRAPARRMGSGRLGRHRRLHRRARAALRPDRDHRRGRALRPRRL